MARQNSLTAERVREVLDYSESDGLLRWKVRRKSVSPGDIAGALASSGYRKVKIDGVVHCAHRVVYLHVHGRHADGPVDHIDRNRDNNRISNLRVVTPSENSQNREAAQSNSQSGLIGAMSGDNGRFRARIRVGGKRVSIGSFADAESAHRAYIEAKKALHPSFTADAALPSPAVTR